MQTRAFNAVFIDHDKGNLTKSSFNKKKLKEEIFYYLNLPKKIARFFPMLIDYKKDYSEYTLEYIPSDNLAQKILAEQISYEEGCEIMQGLLTILNKIHAVQPDDSFSSTAIHDFYIKKTLDRIKQLAKDEFFQAMLQESSLKINNKEYKNFSLLEDKFIQLIKIFSQKNSQITAIHGDFCFSNILYSSNKEIKLIDPRGSFADIGIYGHNYYDYAKIIHCLHGKYDYLVNDQFNLLEFGDHNFYLELPKSPLLTQLHYFYLNLLTARGINIEFIYLIEASLFLSMASLHYENKVRQKALYLTGLMILNNVIEGRYAHLY